MSLYSEAVAVDAPLRYWRLSKNSGAENSGGTAITLNGTASENVGPLVTGDEGATSFDGTNDFGSVAVNLSAVSVLTLEFWLKWDNNANDDDLAFEFSPNYNASDGFIVDPNSSTSGGRYEFGFHDVPDGTSVRYVVDAFTRPSQGAWHHIVHIMDRTTWTNTAYVDGKLVSLTATNHAGVGLAGFGNFANSTLYVMCRNNAALFGAGDLAHVALYSGALSKARVEAHYAAALAVPPEEHSGSAAVSGGGSVAGAGIAHRQGVAGASGGGSVSAQGSRGTAGSASASGGGATQGTGHKAASSSSTVSGAGEVQATGRRVAHGSTSVSGGGADSAEGGKRASGSATASAGGSASASGAKRATTQAGVSGGGQVPAAGTKHATGAASVSGGGNVSATGGSGGEFASGSASASGGGGASAEGRKRGRGSGFVSGGGSATIAWVTVRRGSASVSGGGQVSALGGRESPPGDGVVLALTDRAAADLALSARPQVDLKLSHHPATTLTLEDGP